MIILKGHDADALLPSSYRPISLTSSVSKVFEKVLLGRLDCYALESDLFPEEQAGFRKGRSPIEQAYILREVLDYRKRLNRKTTFLCFVDLQSAFPSTWREGMWRRLHEAQISGKLFRLIKSLYTDCSSAVLTDAGLTDWFKVEQGTGRSQDQVRPIPAVMFIGSLWHGKNLKPYVFGGNRTQDRSRSP